MAFNPIFKNLEDVLTTYQLSYKEEMLILATSNSPSTSLSEDLAFTFKKVPFDISEAAICENIIYPILKDAWKRYADKLALWSHRAIQHDEVLTGVPDYIIAKQSSRGKIFFEHPILAVVEAKRDDFIGGWAQCSLEMLTIQKLNAGDTDVYGIVSNGDFWEFSRLEKDIFWKYSNSFSLGNLFELYNAVSTILQHSVEQLEMEPA